MLKYMISKSKYIIEVVPLTRISLSRHQSFSYSSSEEIPQGSLVSVSFFYRNIDGIVITSYSCEQWTKKFALKPIRSILEKSFLTSRQLELAKFTSDYYLCPLGIVLKSFIPKRVKARKKNLEKNTLSRSKKITLTSEQKLAVKKIQTPAKSKSYLYGLSGSGKTEVYIETIKKINPTKQALILLPDLILASQAIERYSANFKSEEIVLLHSKISKGEFYQSWKKIRTGEAKIIIGARMALFAPFKKLGLIVVDEEHDSSFKQRDANPRYDARTVAEKLAEIYECNIVFGSSTPSISSFYKTKKKQYQLVTLPAFKIRKTAPEVKIELVNMRKERWIKNHSPISKRLESEISYALKHKLQTILFVNHQGMSQFSVCASCQTVFKCPKCEGALIYDQDGSYYCLHCSYRSSMMPHCAVCNGIVFRNIGVGTQKIEREITDRFPFARIARADKQTMRASHAQEKLYKDFKEKKLDILIGTQIISNGWDLPSVALVGIIDADNLLTLPDFGTQEKAYQNILQTAGRAGRPNSKFPGLVLIQTFNPDSLFLQTVVSKDFSRFYQKEIEERKALDLPPFSQIIKLIFRARERKRVERESQRGYMLLRKQTSAYLKKKIIQIFEPQSPLVSNIRGQIKKQIIIKIKDRKEIPQELKRVIISLPAGWIVDVDPISII